MSYEQLSDSQITTALPETPSAAAPLSPESRQLLALARMRFHALQNHFGHVKRDSLTRALVVVFVLGVR